MDAKKAKFDLQEVILRLLEKGKPIQLDDLIKTAEKSLGSEENGIKRKVKAAYTLKRTTKKLDQDGLIKILPGIKSDFAKITNYGKNRLQTIKLNENNNLIPTKWDGLWRIVILDISENRKQERDAIRYILKKANFTCLKNSVWISPFPLEHFLINLKQDLGLGDEMIISVANYLDSETAKKVVRNLRK